MGKTTGFMEYERLERGYRPVEERVKSYDEFTGTLDDDELSRQGARCMDCGIPFCQANGSGRWRSCIRPTTSPNLPAESARRLARRRVPSTSPTSR